jgi:N-succinyl-L-ornithine transcarbamylase
MKHFTTVHDVKNIDSLIDDALLLKNNPFTHQHLGKNKTLGLIFLNPSLRTRMSAQKAAMNLGMNVISMNVDKDGWALEYEDGAIMNGNKIEHIKDAAAVMGTYCDIIGIRCFPNLQNKAEDYSEKVFIKFMKYCKVPIISLESATLHPLQSFADLISIKETWKQKIKPKIVLTWAPHIKALPQAVANSFSEWMLKADYDLTIAHPNGYELSEDYTGGAKITNNQKEAMLGADYVYVKNWSCYNEYGKITAEHNDWVLTKEKMKITNDAKIMHCLPVRRNIELSDELIDCSNSLIIKQAENRVYAAQAVLKSILEKENIITQKINHEEKLANS